MSRRTYYEILQVSRNADQIELKRSYRKLARQFHPDQNPDDPVAEERFKEIAEAYSVLSDETLRRRYDAFGSTSPLAKPSVPIRPEQMVTFFAEQVRQRVRNRLRRSRGDDLRLPVSLHFVEAARGCRRIVELPVREYGREIIVRRRFEFRIPPGTADGQKLRWRGRGMPGSSGGETGDFIMEIEVRTHPLFERSGNDVLVPLPLTRREAEEGCEIEVPTLRGPKSMRVPAGATDGVRIRLPGRGVRRRGGEKGDLVFTVLVAGSDSDASSWPREVFEQTCDQVRAMAAVR